MKRLIEFFDALATPGGNLLILCFFVIISGIAVNKVHYSDEVDTVMISVFSGFSGALLQALSSNRPGPKVPIPLETEKTP